MSTPVTPNRQANTIPVENAVSSESGFSGPEPRPRDKSPEHQWKPQPGEKSPRNDPEAPEGPVNISVKGAAGDAPGQPDEAAAPDNGVSEETKAKTTGMGKHGV